MSRPFHLAEPGSVYQVVWQPLSFGGSDFMLDGMNVKPKPNEEFNIRVVLISGGSLGEYSVHDDMSLGFFLRNRLNIINASNLPARAVLVSGEVHYDQAFLQRCRASCNHVIMH